MGKLSTAYRSPQRQLAWQQWTDGVILLVVLLVCWQLASWILGASVLPSPWKTLTQFIIEVGYADFPENLIATVNAFGIALTISVIGGIVIGLLLGVYRLAGDVMDPILIAVYSVPKIVLYPVILLMFGLGISAKIAFGVLHGIIPIIIFTMTAVRNIPPIYLRSARVYRLSPRQNALYVLIPAAVPEIVVGLRIGFSLTLLGTLLGEMFASQVGIGHMLMRAIDRDNTPTIMALAVMLFVFATLISMSLLRWHRSLSHGA
ncbi:MAG: ABC transporter permease subunit [Paralcaligenes sp.]